jgi:ATP-dependent RNA helicase DHX8/PRP22
MLNVTYASYCSIYIYIYVCLDEEFGVLGDNEEDDAQDIEIELNEDEPAFLRGQTSTATDISPIKVVKNPEGSLQRAALTQSALSKERREIRDTAKTQQLDAIPQDLSRAWEDPLVNKKYIMLMQ